MGDQIDSVTAQKASDDVSGGENAVVEPVTTAADLDATPVAVDVPAEASELGQGEIPQPEVSEAGEPEPEQHNEPAAAIEGAEPVTTAAADNPLVAVDVPVAVDELGQGETSPPAVGEAGEPDSEQRIEPAASIEEAEPVTTTAASDVAPVAVDEPATVDDLGQGETSQPEVGEAGEPETEQHIEPAAAIEETGPVEMRDSALTEPVHTEAGESSRSAVGTEEEHDASESDDGSGQRKVRVLSVGQQVDGTVKRIADFGAFVDIGVGRDGLIHISELSVRRVGKVTDVLSEGQAISAWIKKLDRERNRISLTLIDPETKTIRDLDKDEIVKGTVTRILPYGAFVDIGIGRDALLHVREMAEGYVAKPEDVVKVGEEVEARIIELSRRRGRVDLSLKGLRPEPEVAIPVRAEQPDEQLPAPSGELEDDVPDMFEDTEVLSPMELAFKRAVEAEGLELRVNKKKQGKRNRRERNRSIQDEIVARTLESGKK